jgi:hypothetical protein
LLLEELTTAYNEFLYAALVISFFMVVPFDYAIKRYVVYKTKRAHTGFSTPLAIDISLVFSVIIAVLYFIQLLAEDPNNKYTNGEISNNL